MNYYSTKKLAEKMGCDVELVRSLISKGELKAYRFGERRYVISEENLEQYLNRKITPNFSRVRF